MKLRQSVIVYFSFIFSLSVSAQESDVLYQLVTIHYDNVPLEYALSDISANYGVNFAYSKDFIPVNEKVTAHIIDRRLEIALEELFSTTQIVFAVFNDRIGLRVDPNKSSDLLSQVGEGGDIWDGLSRPNINIKPNPYAPTKKDSKQILTPETESREILVANDKLPTILEEMLKEDEVLFPGGGDTYQKPEIDLEEFKNIVLEKKKNKNNFKGQISLVPRFSTNSLSKIEEKINNISVNVLWGTNKGLNGMELGGLVNSIDEDAEGVQVAGLGNTVGGNVEGTQIAGLFNVNKGYTEGVQMAGLVNHTQAAKATQLAGLVNIASGNFNGFQMAGLANVIEGNTSGAQVAGLFNISLQDAGTQYAGLINVAENVEYSQVAGLVNVAHTVKGNQFGLINIADTVYGAPIALLNFIEHGYNRVEIAAYNNGLNTTIGLKLGTQSFYNIIQAGLRLNSLYQNISDGSITTIKEDGAIPIWGIGYGIGTTITLGNRWLTNIEVVSSHINQNVFWTRELNLLNQFKLSMTWRLNKFSLFLGPNLNLMFSKVYNLETQEFGTLLSKKHLYDATNSNGLNTRVWIGFSGGFRF